MSKKYDVIVLGLGGMGTSASYYLTQKKLKVLGLEQFDLAHSKGSSHGKSRLIRKAYFEHPDYVPLLKRSYELWDALIKDSGQEVLKRTGLIIYGPKEGGKVLPGIRQSAALHDLKIEEYSEAECRKKFPKLKVPGDFVGVYEPGAGYLEVEKAVQAYGELAQNAGAELHFAEEILGWKKKDSHYEVKTIKGSYEAEQLVITAGAWSSKVLGDIGMELVVRRVPLFWFDAGQDYSFREGFPCFAYDMPYGFIYGFPYVEGEGIKIAPHIAGEVVTNPSELNRELLPGDSEPVLKCLQECLPEISPKIKSSAVCMYTMSKDSHFIVDTHPRFPGVHFACGFSGHGYKFASVIGEVLSDLVKNGRSKQPTGFLKLR